MQSDLGKLFIGGISWETNEERLKEYFSSFGEVIEAVIMKDRTTGRARGFGFIVYSDPAVADSVVKEKHNIDGRLVEAKKAVPRDDQNIMSRSSGSVQGSPGPGRTRKIFVGGLASTVTENDFKMYFEQFGTITDVVVMYDHNTQRPRGFGFITYDSEEAVDRVLTKTFHELNNKTVEVKRAVPKELSPGPTRSPGGGLNYGINRLNSLFNGYTQDYNPTAIGGYGVRMDGRFSPIASGRSGFSPYGSGFGMGLNFEPGMNANYGPTSNNFGSGLSYGRGLNPYYVSNSNRFSGPISYDGGNGGNTSLFSSSRNPWGNGDLNYVTSPTSSSAAAAFMGSGTGNVSGSFGSTDLNWSPSQVSRGRGGNLGYIGADSGYNLGSGGYGRSSGSNLAPTSSTHVSSNGGFDGALSELYGGSSIYADPTWRAGTPERDGSGSFSYGLGNAGSDISTKGSAGFVGGYGVNMRQSNRGLPG
ncbi:hypothetical protein RND81_14G007800 [Saponaria officinalis]|uniref:RRM domain-containing protein n=1 Tax=Saponaria officinalis TaxID=3572 RepID=A0AAW1GLM6_SAPOF